MLSMATINYAFQCCVNRIQGGVVQNVRLGRSAKLKIRRSTKCHIVYGVWRDQLGCLRTFFIELNDQELDALSNLLASVKGAPTIRAVHRSQPVVKPVAKPVDESWGTIISRALAKAKQALTRL